MRAALKKGGRLQPRAWAMGASKELTASIFLRRQTGKREISSMSEEAFEEEIMLKSLRILCHISCRCIHIAQSLVDVLSCSHTSYIGSQSLSQALVDLFDGCIDLGRRRANLRHSIIQLLRQLTPLNIG